MNISIAALALLTLVILFWRGGGGRIAIAFAALAGSLLSIVGTVAGALFGGLAHVGQAILGAFGG